VLHNGYTGAILELSPGACEKAHDILDRISDCTFQSSEIEDHSLFVHLRAGGFVIDAEVDEIALFKKEYQANRHTSKLTLTIVPTFNCNLHCKYCFVGKKSGTMARVTQAQIVDFVEKRLTENSFPGMSIDWLGGEPLLELGIIKYLSLKFQRLSRKHKIPYHAQVITNGTLLTKDAVQLLKRAGVENLQVTIDGPKNIHDQRRGYKSGKGSSFAAIVEGINNAKGNFMIKLRINVDSQNINNIWPLLDLFENQDWLGPETGIFPYLARVSPFTEVCANVSRYKCEIQGFYETQFEWWKHIEKSGVPVTFNPLYHFPEPRIGNCTAVNMNGYVFTPDAEVYKCGLTLDDPTQSIGKVYQPLDINHPNCRQWLDYSPFKAPCQECDYLPTCLSGCPRNHIHKRTEQIKEDCLYHRKLEDQILAFHIRLHKASQERETQSHSRAPGYARKGQS
jgi:uncharacterized protein